jgi:rhodanese-related sulfurtransferase
LPKQPIGSKKDFSLEESYPRREEDMKKKLMTFAIPIFIICLGFVLPSLSAQESTRIIAVSAKEAANLIDNHDGDNDFAILDIRTPGEFKSGHLPDSVLIDFYSKTFAEKISRLDKNKTYLIYCRSGNRSARSLGLFQNLKFQKVYHMASGIIGWNAEGLPLSK